MSTSNPLKETIYNVLRMDAPLTNKDSHRLLAARMAAAIEAKCTPPVPAYAPETLVSIAWTAVANGAPWESIGCFYRNDMKKALDAVLKTLRARVIGCDFGPIEKPETTTPEKPRGTTPEMPTQPPPTPEMPGVVSSYCGAWESTTLVKVIESALCRAPAGAEIETQALCVAHALIERIPHPMIDKSQPVDALMLMCLNLVRVGRVGQAMPRGSVPTHVEYHDAQMRAPTGDIYKDATNSIYGKAQQFNANPADTLNAPYGNTFRTVDENDARLRDASVAFKALDNEVALGTLNGNLVELQRALVDLAAEIKASVMPRHVPKSSLLADVAPAPMLYDPAYPPAPEEPNEPPRVTATSPFQLYATGVDRCDWCKRSGYNTCNHRLVGVRRD